MLKGNASFELNKGESYPYAIVLDEELCPFVSGVNISCKELNFSHDLTKDSEDSNRWIYVFDEEETKEFAPISTTYTLTVFTTIEELNTQKLIDQEIRINNDENM